MTLSPRASSFSYEAEKESAQVLKQTSAARRPSTLISDAI